MQLSRPRIKYFEMYRATFFKFLSGMIFSPMLNSSQFFFLGDSYSINVICVNCLHNLGNLCGSD